MTPNTGMCLIFMECDKEEMKMKLSKLSEDIRQLRDATAERTEKVCYGAHGPRSDNMLKRVYQHTFADESRAISARMQDFFDEKIGR